MTKLLKKRFLAMVLILIMALSTCTTGYAADEKMIIAPVRQISENVDVQPSDVYYEVFVRAYCDSDGNGVGDFNGLASKLDYLHDLGITAIWLMPITESGSYHGYDTIDYFDVESDYGTMQDFENMVAKAHSRGIKVIMDLVVNHSSNKNPWFVDAIQNPKSIYRDFYKIEESTDLDEDMDNNSTDDARTGTKRLWSASSLAPGYRYMGIFGGGTPELNYDNPKVHSKMISVGKYWLYKGVDGFRLDAAKHIYGDYLDTIYSPEIFKKNTDWWKEFRAGLKAVNPNVYLVGEIWDENEDNVSPFMEKGVFQSTFNFGLATTLLNAAKTESYNGFINNLCQVYDKYGTVSENEFIDATFLTNHDQNRTMSVLDNNVNHARVAASLYLTLPGNPFIYYGEEVGVQGMEPRRDIKEPMPWYQSNSGAGLTNWKPVFDLTWTNVYTFGGKTSVEAQQKDPSSLLNSYKQLISWRKEIPALSEGDVAEYNLSNSGLCSYIRMNEKQKVLVVTNLTTKAITTPINTNDYDKVLKQFNTDLTSVLNSGQLTIAPYCTVVLSEAEKYVTPTQPIPTTSPTISPTVVPTASPTKAPVVSVTKVAFANVSVTLEIGKTYTQKASIFPSNATNKAVTYKTSNSKIATVSSSGKVTAKATGIVKITSTAKDGSGKKAAYVVNVKPKKVTLKSIKSSKKTATVTWSKVNGTTGYKVYYSTKSSKSGFKVKTVTGSSVKITKLPKGKKVYIKVRAYKKSGSAYVYGSYSSIKNVKVK